MRQMMPQLAEFLGGELHKEIDILLKVSQA
jgi:hypothetical protein